ncbi:uncharacterized protein LOC128209388 [Mya arenaria]|uniref:uncharacterized protein LOC128209388 n=1 Tax=Mya arenaria TaxID=6604 RepID=UPI0022E0DA5B|nr:uncharacterized protein LOC128209388 [Mya arenaria]
MAEVIEEVNDNDEKSVFETKGFECDEVVFQFETEEGCEELYAPKSFLALASPVFKAMFEGNFKEKSEGVVEITDFSKKYFLEFLLWCNPGTKQLIDKSNVLEVFPIAHKYAVEPLIDWCVDEMMKWLKICQSKVDASYSCLVQILPMLKILHVAVLYSYSRIIDQAIHSIAGCGSGYFAFEEFNISKANKNIYDPKSVQSTHKTCVKLFQKLPSDIQIRIYRQRLLKTDENN